VNDGGVLLSYDELLADDLARGQLIAPFDVYVDTVDSYFLIYNKERPLSKATELFKDWLKTIKPKKSVT
jgi:LysR family glycine cleavage system transcriptional activator